MASNEQPKKAQTAYFMWLNEHRAEISKEIGSSKIPEVARKAAEKWKALSTEEKKSYEDRAAKAKVEYDEAMRAFKEGGGVVVRKSKKDKASKKNKKDPNAPKRPAGGGYGVYLAQHREEIKKVMPADHKITDLAKVAAARWKALNEEEKKVYEEKYKAKNEEYKTALAEYKAAGGADGDEADKTAASPPAKPASRKRAADESAKKEAKGKPAKRGRISKGAAGADAVKLDQDVIEAAQKLKMESALRNLAARSEIVALNLPQQKILQALKESDGLVNPAKRALLGA
jgi:hypothetical protein